MGGDFTALLPQGAASAARNYLARLENDTASQVVSVPHASRVIWNRSGAAPEVSHVTFEGSTDGGVSWNFLGRGTRIGTTANWALSGLSLPAAGSIRVRGRTTGGQYNSSSGLIEQVVAYTASARPAPLAPDGTAAGTTGDETTVAISFPATDVDGNAVAITNATGSVNLTVNSFTATTVTFTPSAAFAGDAVLNYIVTDGSGATATGTITVTIEDNDLPEVKNPGTQTREATSAAGAAVTLSTVAKDDVSPDLRVNFSPASGSTFGLGTTSVTASATDAAGNTGTTTFDVVVRDTTPPETTITSSPSSQRTRLWSA